MTTAPQSLLLENQQASLQNLDCQSNLVQTKTNRKQWSIKEDMQLEAAIYRVGTKWLQIAAEIPNRNPSQCAQRWKRIKPQSQKRGTYWSEEEDAQVLRFIEIYPKKWGKIAKQMINRTSKQVRERFINKLNPNINRDPFTQEEDMIIYESYKTWGSQWTKIAKLLKSRPENMVKNRFYSHIRRQYMHEENPYYIIPQQISHKKGNKLQCQMTKLTNSTNIGAQVKLETQDQMKLVKEENQSEPLGTTGGVIESNQDQINPLPIIQPILYTQPLNPPQPYFYQQPVYFAFSIPTICYFPFEQKNDNLNRLMSSQSTMPDI